MKIKILLTAALFTAFAFPAQAQTMLPDAPKPNVTGRVADRQFWIVTGLLAAAKATDSITTKRALNRGAIESNPLYGPRPSSARIAGTDVAVFAGEVGIAYLLKRVGRGHWWGRAWMMEPAWSIGEGARGAIHNERLPGKKP